MDQSKTSLTYSLISGFLLLFMFAAAVVLTYALQEPAAHDTSAWLLIIVSVPLIATVIWTFFIGFIRSAKKAALLLTVVPPAFMVAVYLIGLVPDNAIPHTVNAALVWLGAALICAMPGLLSWLQLPSSKQ